MRHSDYPILVGFGQITQKRDNRLPPTANDTVESCGSQ
jgi:hypothetical protein